MAKTVQLINPETNGTISGTITDEEYETYIEEGFVEVDDVVEN